MQQGRYAARLIQRRVTDRPALNAAAPIQMTPLRNARLNASVDASVASLLLMSSSIPAASMASVLRGVRRTQLRDVGSNVARDC
jgi:hypothetical protein